MVSGCYYWPQKSSTIDFCAKRICCSNIFLFQGMKILYWIEETGKLKIGANTPIPVQQYIKHIGLRICLLLAPGSHTISLSNNKIENSNHH